MKFLKKRMFRCNSQGLGRTLCPHHVMGVFLFDCHKMFLEDLRYTREGALVEGCNVKLCVTYNHFESKTHI